MGDQLRARMTWRYRAWRYRLLVERPGVHFVREHLKPGQLALDIGAHKGAYLYWMQRAVGCAGRVVAYEPQPELANYLSTVVGAERLEHVTVVNSALSD